MNKYVLIGIPGSGKSTIGKRTAESLKIPFYNTDSMASESMTPEQKALFLSVTGAKLFVQGLYDAIVKLAKLDKPAIIEACPESPLMPSHLEVIKKIGPIIYIKRDTESVLAEVLKKRKRMFMHNLTTGSKIDMQAESVRLYAKESHKYEALADMILDNSGNEDEAVAKLVAMIKEHGAGSTNTPPAS